MELNKNNFYIKIIDFDEIYNFCSFEFFYLKSLICKKKIYLYLKIFSTFYGCILTMVEPATRTAQKQVKALAP